jgi:hypothetical protein
MGLAISDITTADMIFQLNSRFAFGPPLNEMVGIQTEFKIFSDKYSLRQAFLLLHIVPADYNPFGQGGSPREGNAGSPRHLRKADLSDHINSDDTQR